MLELVSDFITAFINFLSAFFFSKIILKQCIYVKKYVLILILLFMSSFLLCMYYLDINTIKTVFCFIMVAILFKVVYSLDIIKSILLSFSFFVIQIFSDMISLTFLFLIVDKGYVYEIMSGSFVGNIIVMIVTLLFALIFSKIIDKIVNIKLKYSLIFTLVLNILCIIAVFYSTYQMGANSLDNFLGLLCVVIMVIILSYSFLQIYKLFGQYFFKYFL